MTEPDHIDRPDGHIRSPAPGYPPRVGRWTPGLSAAIRLLLLFLSVGGTLAVLGACASGHARLAVRMFAGDIVLILAALLLL